MTALTDLDLRDHVPDQLEVHLGDTHDGVEPVPAIASVMYGSNSRRK